MTGHGPRLTYKHHDAQKTGNPPMYEAQRASSGGPAMLNFHTSLSYTEKYMNGRLRWPAAACGGDCGRRSPRCRSPRCRSPRCRPTRCRSPRCLLAAVCGAARPRRRFHRDQRSARRRAPKRTEHYTCRCGRGTPHVKCWECFQLGCPQPRLCRCV